MSLLFLIAGLVTLCSAGGLARSSVAAAAATTGVGIVLVLAGLVVHRSED